MKKKIPHLKNRNTFSEGIASIKESKPYSMKPTILAKTASFANNSTPSKPIPSASSTDMEGQTSLNIRKLKSIILLIAISKTTLKFTTA